MSLGLGFRDGSEFGVRGAGFVGAWGCSGARDIPVLHGMQRWQTELVAIQDRQPYTAKL